MKGSTGRVPEIPGSLWARIAERAAEIRPSPGEVLGISWNLPGISVKISPRNDSSPGFLQDILTDSSFHAVIGKTERVSTGLPRIAYWEGILSRIPKGPMEYTSPVTGVRYQVWLSV